MLTLAEVTALLAEAFRGRPGRSNFRTGTLTMCTMHPMRSVPHRVVCLLGVDDGVFPRRGRLDGDDVTAVDARVGDPDPRSEDRQLLLDAVMAAQEHLVVVFAGMDPRTGADIPPAVPVKELLDAARPHGAHRRRPAPSAHVTVRHRLQPFDPANFARGGLEPAARRAFSFDPPPCAGRGRRCARGPSRRSSSRGPRCRPLPDEAARSSWPSSTRFFRHPLRALLRARAAVSLYGEDERARPRDPGRPRRPGALGGRRADARPAPAGRASSTCCARPSGAAATCRPAAFGTRCSTRSPARWPRSGSRGRALPGRGAAAEVELAARLGDRPLVGHRHSACTATTWCSVSFSRLSARHRLQAWLELLALTALRPGRPWRAVSVARRGRSVLGPLDAGLGGPGAGRPRRAAAHRAAPSRCRSRPKTSAEYAADPVRDRPLAAAEEAAPRRGRDEGDDLYARFFDPPPGGHGPTGLDALLAEPSRAAEDAAASPSPAASAPWPAGSSTPCSASRGSREQRDAAAARRRRPERPRAPSTSAARCPPAPPCSRPARARARPSPSRRSPPATWPRASSSSTELMLVTFGRNATWSCGCACGNGWSPTEAALRGRSPGTPLPPVDEVGRPPLRRHQPPSSSSRRRPGRPGAGRVRRRHHRHHPRVLPADARRAGRARRPGAAGGVRRAPRRPDPRGRQRRLPAPLRTVGRAPRSSFDEALEVAQRAVAAVHARLVPDAGRPGRGAAARRAGGLRRRGAPRGRAAQAARPAVHLRRHADPAARRPRRPRAGATAAAERLRRPLPRRHGRRVPGHRPGAVGDPAAGLPRARDADPHRGPQAGHLRVPRRRRLQLPRRAVEQADDGGDPRHQLAQRRRRWWRRSTR